MIDISSRRKVAVTTLSNNVNPKNSKAIEELCDYLRSLDLEVVVSNYLYGNNIRGGSAKEVAEEFVSYYKDEDISFVFDVSGGDIANETLEYIDFNVIGNSPAVYCGYSDLTTIIDSIYSQTGRKSILYQIKNVINDEASREWFTKMVKTNTMFDRESPLMNFEYRTVRDGKNGETSIEGTLMGGNLRCLLKLAGTKYMPSFKDKILFLESMGGRGQQTLTAISQYKQLGILDEVKGIVLGSFTIMEQEKLKPLVEEMMYERTSCPLIKTDEIGHQPNSKALVIGDYYKFSL